jgi:hypothetical protein
MKTLVMLVLFAVRQMTSLKDRHRPADNIKMFLAVIHLAQDKD